MIQGLIQGLVQCLVVTGDSHDRTKGLTQGLIQCLVVMCAQGLIQYHIKTPFETLQCKQQLVMSAILHVDAERRRHGKTIPTVDLKQIRTQAFV